MADQSAVRAAAEPVLSSLGLELVDVEVVGSGRARTVFEWGPAPKPIGPAKRAAKERAG